MEFYASCPAAFEQALAAELRALGIRRVRPLKGRVTFEGEPRDAYRACLWSHLASRIYLVIERIPCTTADDLYHGVYELPWQQILRAGSSIAITAHGANDELRNTRFSMLRAKDAIVDRLLDETGTRPAVDTRAPDARLLVSIRGERASICFDLSGEALFKRLSRGVLKHAPDGVDILRPDYAALLLATAGWPGQCRAAREDGAGALLVDAACAEGGVLLEAALWMRDQAPGIARARWGFHAWGGHDARAWRAELAEARRRTEEGAGCRGRILATDVDPQAVEAARRVVAAAGMGDAVAFVKADSAAITDAAAKTWRTMARPTGNGAGPRPRYGSLVADLSPMSASATPIGMRLFAAVGAAGELAGLPAASLGRAGVAPRIPGRPAGTAYTLMLGSDELDLAGYAPADSADAAPCAAGDGPGRAIASADGAEQPGTAAPADSVDRRAPEAAPPRAASHAATVDVGTGAPIPLIVPESEQFAHRLIKVARQRRRWAKRAGVTCYRVYDADLPDYAAAIDLYIGDDRTPGRWLVVAEYAAPKTIDPALAQDRMMDILAIAPRVLDVPLDHVHAKTRMRSRGGSQYGRQRASARHGGAGSGRAEQPILIQEGGLSFAVEFDDRLDTGIFLDHRVTRGLVREHARGARSFLNLFAYTGTATCYAADGGARETTTVDLSNTYLDWAAYNMELNGFTGRNHRFVRADVLSWIDEQRYRQERWDLIFCDPPTFSNSTRMGERTFDVQRDHVELLEAVTRLLAPGGLAIFSCNLRRFRPDLPALEDAGVALEDITAQTIPEDFQRNPRIHHCYIARRA